MQDDDDEQQVNNFQGIYRFFGTRPRDDGYISSSFSFAVFGLKNKGRNV